MLGTRRVLGDIDYNVCDNGLSNPISQKGGLENKTRWFNKRQAEWDILQPKPEKKQERVQEQSNLLAYSACPFDTSTQNISSSPTELVHTEVERKDHDELAWMTRDVAHYSCKLSLDSQTAHPHISLSEGDTQAVFLSDAQSHPDHPQRFDVWPQVLCRERLRDGRFSWEVTWDRYAAIGVAYKSITRKGKAANCGLGFNNKSWSLLCEKQRYFAWHNGKRTTISELPESSRRIRVCLDMQAGAFAFYKVVQETLIHLHTFRTTFTEPVYPMFRFYYFGKFGSSVALEMK